MSSVRAVSDVLSTQPNAAGPARSCRATSASLKVIGDNTPAELLSLPCWVGWDGTMTKDGKLDKTPINPTTGGNAMSNNAATWGTFEQACSLALREDRVGGLGLVLTNSDYWALDLDHVIDVATGEIAPAARTFLACITPTYMERSPSGDGLHVIYRGRRPDVLTSTKARDAFGAGKHLEVFGGNSGRYITMTGQVWGTSA